MQKKMGHTPKMILNLEGQYWKLAEKETQDTTAFQALAAPLQRMMLGAFSALLLKIDRAGIYFFAAEKEGPSASYHCLEEQEEQLKLKIQPLDEKQKAREIELSWENDYLKIVGLLPAEAALFYEQADWQSYTEEEQAAYEAQMQKIVDQFGQDMRQQIQQQHQTREKL
ncbi:hypothetical protein PPO43_03445 [Saprospira sp. CCB-QB6]|uniref:hypothetical protein n=1 Tax=Saprospira sp. CCB-QB6 TaxID=3023936 RepID=UPI00234AD0D5|nr:hypothetical protein [Saprospira sp. CCB-QB6]WCL82157.1 hypothetical protein PPO43_03445 [Saprospira sp. CCB-QB6]